MATADTVFYSDEELAPIPDLPLLVACTCEYREMHRSLLIALCGNLRCKQWIRGRNTSETSKGGSSNAITAGANI